MIFSEWQFIDTRLKIQQMARFSFAINTELAISIQLLVMLSLPGHTKNVILQIH